MIPTETVIATPNPTGLQVTAATGVTAVVTYGAGVLAASYGVPPAVTVAVLSALATVLTSVWHRFFGPGVPVTKPVA